jgi:hypothetical protein
MSELRDPKVRAAVVELGFSAHAAPRWEEIEARHRGDVASAPSSQPKWLVAVAVGAAVLVLIAGPILLLGSAPFTPADSTSAGRRAGSTSSVVPTTGVVAHSLIPASGPLLGEALEPGTYLARWTGPDFVITFTEPSFASLEGTRQSALFVEPSRATEWDHPDNFLEPLTIAQLASVYRYEGDVVQEVRRVDDPTEFLLNHPYLSLDAPTPLDLDGYQGLQFDGVVTGAAWESDWMHFGLYAGSAPVSMPVGSAVRIMYFEGDDRPFWVFVTTARDGFEEGTAYAADVLSTVEFD